METTLIAYHGRPELKAQFLQLAREHREADRVIRGTYDSRDASDHWKGGCAVGCTLESARRIAG